MQSNDVTINGVTYTVEAWDSEGHGFYPMVHTQDGQSVNIGPVDEADAYCETPAEALALGEQALRNVNPAAGVAAETLGLEDALAVSDYQGARAEGADDYIYHVSEEQDEETGQRYYLLQITHGAMPPHYSERFDSISEMKQMRPLSEYPQLEWTAAGDAEV